MEKMMKVIDDARDFVARLENSSDPRVKDWPLVQDVRCPLAAITCYILIVIIGPKLMRNRKALEVKFLMTVYNLLAVILSAYMLIKIILRVTEAKYNMFCQPINHSFDNPLEMEIARLLWIHYMSKYFEMLDTLIFIVRKKETQISFLHVYHHTTVILLWWIGTKWLPGGSSFVPAVINSFVHVVMYTYYGLSRYPTLRKYLWWKRYLTQLQMTQFCLLISHSLYVAVSDCRSIFPPYMAIVCILYAITLLLLFGKFYLGAYFNQKKESKSIDGYGGAIMSNGDKNKKL
ncbi:elongation of very long chain fatty acids protein 4-like isoform X2 [Xenia sp. Carnegie-2017]|uniref:elongation of very long chain fatty acids protein 4-like isoform X2 n=1 Tax=Xenia sp. Carnegie-2017 TaxID=2897299 RepID=UPI001F044AF4|nr:elongation of very long chain fatty acids protein 4-like isoform X2 [Xenia sp. Carnegie-2017]